MRRFPVRLMVVACAVAVMLPAQVPPAPAPQVPAPQAPAPAPPQAPVPAPPQAPSPAQPPAGAPPQRRLADERGFLLGNVSLTEMIDIIAKMLKINYILDPRVKGAVTIYTYGEVKPVDLMPLLETILRVNGATMVKVGDLYRIVPINAVSQLPLEPMVNVDPKTLPDDERMILNLVFLKYTTTADMAALIKPFVGEGATLSTYDPANLLLIEDNSRNMKRTMELIAMFDSDTFAGQRVRLFDVTNSRPSDLVKELESVFRAYALSEKNSAVKFIPVDRINTIIAVAPNPGIFTQVQTWIEKLDIPVKITAGAVNNYVYRLRYGRAETVAMAIMALYTGNTSVLTNLAMANSGMLGGMGYGGGAYGGFGGGGYGGGGYGGGGYGGGGYGGGGYGGYGGGMGPPGAYGGGGYNLNQGMPLSGIMQPPVSTAVGATANPIPAAGPMSDLTGSYLGYAGAGGQSGARIPHVIPNPFDNTLLIQGTPQEYEQITNLLRQLDVPPRQVLIEAKIYEVDLTGAFSSGVSAFLQQRGASGAASRVVTAASTGTGLNFSVGALVLQSHELLTALTAAESKNHTRIISAPSIVATDSIPAIMNVGEDVPVLTSQAVGGVQQGGSSLFTNTVSNRSTGVTLNIMARVNSSGVVTMIINQDVSSPQAPPAGGIQSPSFQRRSFSTQITVEDGDMVAIGGIIQESNLQSSAGVPVLHKIPLLGGVFGSRSITKQRTELIVFLTPRVIYDTTQVSDATEEIKGSLKRVQKLMRDQ